MAKLHLVLGGARSGKSSFAEQRAIKLASETNSKLVYVATASADDNEMVKRIAHHQNGRNDSWLTVESPLELTSTLSHYSQKQVVILVDCLTLWLSNHLCQENTEIWPQAKSDFLALCSRWQSCAADVIFVSNEVGHGIVPLGKLSRDFVDESGWLHQELAKLADQVDFIMAGLPLTLKAETNK